MKTADFQMSSRAITINKYTEEPKLGADILVVTSFQSPTLSISKDYLVQAKMLDSDGNLRTREWTGCKSSAGMQEGTLESYVWYYSSRSFEFKRLSWSNTPNHANLMMPTFVTSQGSLSIS
ncbi:MAG: hypothetical protein R3D85_09430 [Paracoccaceae bacterium]